MNHQNIILIGMAATGKSTLGRRLAKRLDWAFVDTDLLMEAWWGAPLQTISDYLGLEAFVQAEAQQIQRMHLRHCVIATGGSVVYSEAAMAHLQGQGHIVYIESSFESISRRLTNPTSRGLAIGPGQTLKDLYDERAPLYARFAQLTVNTDGATPSQTCSAITRELSRTTQDES
ncbi:MAG: shikimate kinase [Deltaproteobacteria bacterium HGW-Deltaproteobacteria-18]|nr:MAG: shikimate kinase [Deltaproteobacteria bacterium HGW-Deltaproteobacteria-18]